MVIKHFSATFEPSLAMSPVVGATHCYAHRHRPHHCFGDLMMHALQYLFWCHLRKTLQTQEPPGIRGWYIGRVPSEHGHRVVRDHRQVGRTYNHHSAGDLVLFREHHVPHPPDTQLDHLQCPHHHLVWRVPGDQHPAQRPAVLESAVVHGRGSPLYGP